MFEFICNLIRDGRYVIAYRFGYQKYNVSLNYYGKYKLKVCFTETENGITVQVLAEEKSGRKLDIETENFFADFDSFRKEQDTLFEVPAEKIPELFSWIENRAKTGKLLFADFFN